MAADATAEQVKSSKEGGPMRDEHGYSNGEILVEAAWLREHLDDPGLKILDARGPKEHASGHIARAIPLSANAFKVPGSQDPVSAEEFAREAGGLGIRASDTVVCYDAAGPTAARAWWVFARFGHPNVRFLNGGLKAWQAAGYPSVLNESPPEPVVYGLGAARDEIACSLAEAAAAHVQGQAVSWDTRTAGEYAGLEHPMGPPARPGHIPGAVQLEWSDLTDPGTGRFKPAAEMRQVLAAQGITPEKDVITY
jgi:thiosulfate/3-mercaptopyruvate sulfurtransferase